MASDKGKASGTGGAEVVPFPQSDATGETAHKTALLEWANKTADAVIAAALDDVALHFIESSDDDEQIGTIVDLAGDYDPIVNKETGLRLSEEIKRAAETLRESEKVLKRFYATALKKQWADHPKEIPSEPKGTFYGRSYLVNQHGVWLRQPVAGLEPLAVWRRIVETQVDLEAMSYDTTLRRNWQHRYVITNETGQFPVDIAHEDTAKDANPAIKILMRRGVRIVESRAARQHFAKFLQRWPHKRIIRAPRTGWFEWRGHWVFVLPNEVLGATDRMHIILDDTIRSGGYGVHRAGTSEQWREYVVKPLARNSNVILAIGTFLATPLLRWANEPPGAFHSWGRNNIGKTLCGAVGQSLYGRPYRRGAAAGAFGYTWESTANRLEQRAALHNDLGLYLDEIGVGDKKSIAPAIYKFGGGLGKGRMNQQELDFNILAHSTGEKSLTDFLPNVQPGQMTRLADVPAEVQPGSALETIPAHEVEAESRKFYDLMDEFHGSAGHEYLEHLATLIATLTPKGIKARVKKDRASFLARPEVVEIIRRAHPQLVSVAHRFALLAVASAIAVEAGILPWTVADTDAGIIACMKRWVTQRCNLDAAGELLRQIEERRRVFAATADDRLIPLAIVGRRLVAASPADQHKLEAAAQFDGYIKDGRFLLTPDAWRRLWAGLDVEKVKKHLRDRQLLLAGRKGEIPRNEKYKSGARAEKFYVLAPAFIDRV